VWVATTNTLPVTAFAGSVNHLASLHAQLEYVFVRVILLPLLLLLLLLLIIIIIVVGMW
jgi:hypothetical protein